MADRSPPTRAVPKATLPIVGEMILDRYRIERMVGTGGMAHVMAARHLALGTEVAIKILDPTLINDFDATERFAREARAMASLASKHTVRVFDVGHLPSGLPFMVMELLVGHDLHNELKKHRIGLPVAEALEYIAQACEAVAEAHAAGIIHRDLKPQNLFLTQVNGQPMIRVLDFGIARSVGAAKLDTITRMGDVVGTLHYMSPEQIKSSKDVNPRSDVWSLGACFYKLLTGYPPFPVAGEAPLMSAILTMPPKPLAEYRHDVPAVVSSIIMRCLRKPQNERYASANDLRLALHEARGFLASDGADDFQANTQLMPKLPGSSGQPKHAETLQSADEKSRERAKLTATMPFDSQNVHVASEVRAAPGYAPPRPGSNPAFSPNRASQPGLMPHGDTLQSGATPKTVAPAKASGGALSFVMIIVAVAIGVFVAGLGLLFVLSRRH